MSRGGVCNGGRAIAAATGSSTYEQAQRLCQVVLAVLRGAGERALHGRGSKRGMATGMFSTWPEVEACSEEEAQSDFLGDRINGHGLPDSGTDPCFE
jgi:hypothetical protein